MTENKPQTELEPTEGQPTELTADERAAITPEKPEPVDAPKDTPEETATGYAVYDRTLGRYVTGVTPDKPSNPGKSVAKGHAYKVVRV